MIEWRPIFLVVGILLIILALFMIPAIVADLAAGNPDWQVFFASGSVTLFTGVTLALMNRAGRVARLVEIGGAGTEWAWWSGSGGEVKIGG